MLRLFVILTLISLAAMVLIDWHMGERAEFLNAWSVVERLVGRSPSAGESVIAARFGAAGELAAVLLANSVLGLALTAIVALAARFLR